MSPFDEHLQHDAFLLPGKMRELKETLIQCLLGLNEEAALEHVEEEQQGILNYLRKHNRCLVTILQRMSKGPVPVSLQESLQTAIAASHSTEKNFIDFFYPGSFKNSELLSYSQTISNLDKARDVLNPEVRAEQRVIDSLHRQNLKNARERAEQLASDLRGSLIKVRDQLPDDLRAFYDLATLFDDLKPPSRDKRQSAGSNIRQFFEYFHEKAKPQLSKQLKTCRKFAPEFYVKVIAQLKHFKYENFEDSMIKLRGFSASAIKERTRSQTSSSDLLPTGETRLGNGTSGIPQASKVTSKSPRNCLIRTGTGLDFLGIKFDGCPLQCNVLEALVKDIADIAIPALEVCSCNDEQKARCLCKVPKLKTPADFKAIWKGSVDNDGRYTSSFRSCIQKTEEKLQSGLATDKTLIQNIKEYKGRRESKSGGYRLNLEAILFALESRDETTPAESGNHDQK